MRLKLLVSDDRDYEFARYMHVGSWSEGRLCSCGYSTEQRIEPALVEWEAGSSKIGDFAWSDYNVIVVDEVRDFLLSHEFECEFGRVEMVPPEKPGRRNQVPWPYEGPRFRWLRATARVPLNEEASGVTLKLECAECGRRKYTFKMDGIVIDRSDWDGQKMFHIEQFGRSQAKFITESALDELESQNFTNLQYRDAGVIQ